MMTRKTLFISLIFLLSLTAVNLCHAEADKQDPAAPAKPLATATFAGGCFWCMQPPFDKIAGVVETTVGYTGGKKVQPSYKDVSSGATKHAEAIQIKYDPTVLSYLELLNVFWHNIDPTTVDGQFSDQGKQYRTAIFYHDEVQRKSAQRSKQSLEKAGHFKQPLVTEITPARKFYRAEDYHQKYYKKNPIRYKAYRYYSGRDRYLESVWK